MNLVKRAEKKDLFKHSLVIGSSLLFVLLASNVISVGVLFFMGFLGFSIESYDLMLKDNWFAFLLNTLISSVAMTFPFLFIKVINKKPVYEICKFNSPIKGLTITCVFFVLGAAMVANYLNVYFSTFLETFFNFKATQPEIGNQNYKDLFELFYTIVGTAMLPALIEEFAFRGLILGSLRKFGDMTAIIVSSLIFGIFHGNFVQIPFATIVGFALGIITVITNSIWPAIIAHFINNSYAVIVNALGRDAISIAFIIMIAFVVLGVVSLLKLIKSGAFNNIVKRPSSMGGGQRVFRLFISPTMIVFLLIMIGEALFYRA